MNEFKSVSFLVKLAKYKYVFILKYFRERNKYDFLSPSLSLSLSKCHSFT